MHGCCLFFNVYGELNLRFFNPLLANGDRLGGGGERGGGGGVN